MSPSPAGEYASWNARPSSHTPAFPHHHRPGLQPRTDQAWPPGQPWSYYGPPPAVPQSLYQTSATSYSPYGPFTDPEPPWKAEAEEKKRFNKGRDYLRDLGSDLASMTLYDGLKPGNRSRPSSEVEKPLPRIPVAPELQHRPHTDPMATTPLADSNAIAGPSSPRKSFRPSPYLILPDMHTRRPVSDPALPMSSSPASGLSKPKVDFPRTPPRPNGQHYHGVIDLTYSPASSSSTSATPTSNVTPRSPARLRKRATSEQPPLLASPAQTRQTGSPASKESGTAIRCAGFTRAGQPCKRLVRAAAPLLSAIDTNLPHGLDPGGGGGSEGDELEVVGRYCKDHAGMICSAGGYYSREKPTTWVAFDGQQTQALLRMTMESRLTAKETPGFIYAYELRDLQTLRTSYFKVGRTDNVPRRIGQWTNQCTSKSPTLRDIFPLPANHSHLDPHQPLHHRRSGPVGSLLPGALGSGTMSDTSNRDPCIAMKRWERLIHLELADLASRERPMEWQSDDLKGKCGDCGVIHKEVFPVARTRVGEAEGGEGCYQVVLEIICRWERFVTFAYGQ